MRNLMRNYLVAYIMIFGICYYIVIILYYIIYAIMTNYFHCTTLINNHFCNNHYLKKNHRIFYKIQKEVLLEQQFFLCKNKIIIDSYNINFELITEINRKLSI